jgi:hypothetical protein
MSTAQWIILSVTLAVEAYLVGYAMGEARAMYDAWYGSRRSR